jgi:hypothetical protein
MSRFIQQEDGYFLDNKTGLVWKEIVFRFV